MVNGGDHYEIFNAFDREIRSVIVQCNEACIGQTGKTAMAEIWLAGNERLTEILRQQRRALEFMAGRDVAAETHFAEAVIVGKGGGGVAP